MERLLMQPTRGEANHMWVRPVAAVVAATVALSACSSEGSSPAKHSVSPTTHTPTRVDPRAYQCDIKPNPHPGTTEECPIPDGGITQRGVPTFRYMNLSRPQKPIPYSSSHPTYVLCRIPQPEIPGSFPSLNDGGEYILYGERVVAAADDFYNRTVRTNELPYDPDLRLCGKAAIAAVTPFP